jgi:tetratricopeptide (TPR) repeat protein
MNNIQKIETLLAECAEYASKGDYQRSTAICLDILNQYRDTPTAQEGAYASLGFINIKEGKPDVAADYLKKALSYSPLEPRYHYLLGTAYLLSKRTSEAAKELEICLKQEPDNLEYQKMLILIRDTAELLNGKVSDEDILGFPGGEDVLLASRAASFLKEGNLKRAREFSENALWANPQNRRARLLLKEIQKKQLETVATQTLQKRAPYTTYQFRAKLRGISPPIWRRFQVSGKMTLYKLHLIMQELMNWDNYHLFEFQMGEARFSVPDPEDFHQSLNAYRYKIEAVAAERSKLLYRYDFGDGWEVELKAEKVIPAAEPLKYAVCLSGKRAAPPEDSGGIPGYARYLEILNTPSPEDSEDENPEIHNMREWIGDFDPEYFNIEEINERLKKIKASL